MVAAAFASSRSVCVKPQPNLSRRILSSRTKRAGAGKKVFLPGRWLTRSFTGPGMEASKAYLYVLWNSSASRPVFRGAPPLKPYGYLFADAFTQKELSGH